MSEQEYIERLSRLAETIEQRALPFEDVESRYERYRRTEFDLTIDYRLGTDFPADRRTALYAAYQQVQGALELVQHRFQGGEISSDIFAAALQDSVRALRAAYETLLTSDELAAMLGGQGEAMRLPLIPAALRAAQGGKSRASK